MTNTVARKNTIVDYLDVIVRLNNLTDVEGYTPIDMVALCKSDWLQLLIIKNTNYRDYAPNIVFEDEAQAICTYSNSLTVYFDGHQDSAYRYPLYEMIDREDRHLRPRNARQEGIDIGWGNMPVPTGDTVRTRLTRPTSPNVETRTEHIPF